MKKLNVGKGVLQRLLWQTLITMLISPCVLSGTAFAQHLLDASRPTGDPMQLTLRGAVQLAVKQNSQEIAACIAIEKLCQQQDEDYAVFLPQDVLDVAAIRHY